MRVYDEESAKKIFYKNFFTHQPGKRNQHPVTGKILSHNPYRTANDNATMKYIRDEDRDQASTYQIAMNKQTASHGNLRRGRHVNTPSWITKNKEPGNNDSTGTNHPAGNGKLQEKGADQDRNTQTLTGSYRQKYVHKGNSRFCLFSLAVLQAQVKRSRSMPLAVHNGLPACQLELGWKRDECGILALVDTGAAVNVGNLFYHQFLMSQIPEAVESYEEFDGSNPFDPLKLGGAIKNPEDYDKDKHGLLTAVVRYCTPYRDSSGHPVVISFGLQRTQ